MTIDNHPLTPKPVDDRGATFQVTQADRDLLISLRGFGQGSVLEAQVNQGWYLADQVAEIARHREQAERGLRDALKLAANRLARAALDHDVGSAKFLEVSEWGEDARKALDTRP